MNQKAADTGERFPKPCSGPMTEADIAFLRDVQGFIDFAIRNGLTFAPVVTSLLHDVSEIVREGFDLEKARSRGFRPHVTEYGRLTSDDFGENEDEEPGQ